MYSGPRCRNSQELYLKSLCKLFQQGNEEFFNREYMILTRSQLSDAARPRSVWLPCLPRFYVNTSSRGITHYYSYARRPGPPVSSGKWNRNRNQWEHDTARFLLWNFCVVRKLPANRGTVDNSCEASHIAMIIRGFEKIKITFNLQWLNTVVILKNRMAIRLLTNLTSSI